MDMFRIGLIGAGSIGARHIKAIDEVAHHLGLDPLVVRRRNFYPHRSVPAAQHGVTQYGQTVADCIIQDIQFHPVTDRVTHIDLLEVLPGKPVKVELPLRTTGQAIGVMNGGRLELNYRRVPVRGLVDQLPECLTVDITPLKIGDNARVRDLEIEGLDILLSESALLVACKRTRAAMSAESALEGEEGAEGGEAAEGGEG